MHNIWLLLALVGIGIRVWRQRIAYTGTHHLGTVHRHRIGNAKVTAEWYACQRSRVTRHRS